MCCVVLCVVCCVVRVVLCVVSCASVRRRRRPSSSSSVRPPSRPSGAVVRRRRPLSVRPSRPSVVVAKLRIQGRMQFLDFFQNMSHTATGLGASDRARSVGFFSRAEIAVRVENVGFMSETLLL